MIIKKIFKSNIFLTTLKMNKHQWEYTLKKNVFTKYPWKYNFSMLWKINEISRAIIKKNSRPPVANLALSEIKWLYCVINCLKITHFVSWSQAVHCTNLMRAEGLIEEVDGGHLASKNTLFVHIRCSSNIAFIERLKNK